MSVTDSISSGCPFAGFIAPAHNCGVRDSPKFRNNVAHSVDGVGAYIYKDPIESSHKTCMEVSLFSGYKNRGSCMATFAHTLFLRVHSLTCIDNVQGVSLTTTISGSVEDRAKI